uniref:Reverse transcriptase domain-containing protein n=1 Tax=Tanacetum cinerariifolium TaxID=118510 RepID=A0A6L2KE70_TANCI|nr:hypothetical protein [Tanacetum cinerariifolium]
MPFSTYANLGLGDLAHTKLTVEQNDTVIKHLRGIAENVQVKISNFIFTTDFIILDIPEDDDVLLILGRPFFSTAQAKIDFFKRKITLRVGEEKLVFKRIKLATSIIRRVYMLKERMDLDSKTEFIGEVINESFNPHYGNYIKLNDLDMPLEPRTNQDDFEPTLDFVNEPTYKSCHKMKFSCMIGYRHVSADFLPALSINIMTKRFYNYIINDKGDQEGKNLAGSLIDIPIFIGIFSIILDFSIINDMDTTSSVVYDMPFCKKFVSCQMIMEIFTHGDEFSFECHLACGNDLRDGFCSLCNSRNSCVYDPNPNSFDCPPDSYHPSHPTYETYLGDSCGNDSHFGYDCPPQVPLNYEPEPGYIQNYNSYPHDSPIFPQQYLCCDNCGGLHETFQCQSMNQNFYNSNSSSFDQTQPPQFPVIHQPPQETSIEILHNQENTINSVQTFLRKFNRYSFFKTPKVLLLAWDKVFKIKDALGNKQYKPEDTQELFRELFNDVQNIHDKLAEYINTPSWNRPAFYNNGDDDDEDCTIAITSDFLIKDSLSMGDEHLDTILEKESGEFIKSSLEDLVPNPSEFEDECECDVLDCDDSQTTHFSMFSNPLFGDSTSSDDESSHEDVIYEMSFKTYSNPLFDLDEEIISRIDEADCDPEEDIHLVKRLLYDNLSPRPPEEFVSENYDAEIEYFSPSPIPVKDSDSFMEEIDLSSNLDDPIPLSIEDNDYDSERDILIREELLDNYSLSLPKNKSFHFDIPSFSRPPAKPPDGNTGILNIKMMGDISEQKVPIPGLTITSVSNQEKSPDLLSHQSPENF